MLKMLLFSGILASQMSSSDYQGRDMSGEIEALDRLDLWREMGLYMHEDIQLIYVDLDLVFKDFLQSLSRQKRVLFAAILRELLVLEDEPLIERWIDSGATFFPTIETIRDALPRVINLIDSED